MSFIHPHVKRVFLSINLSKFLSSNWDLCHPRSQLNTSNSHIISKLEGVLNSGLMIISLI